MTGSLPNRVQALSGVACALLAASPLAVAGCGAPRCGDHGASDEAGAPRIDSFYVLEGQFAGDPWTVLFGVEVTDSTGDLGSGRAELYLNDATEPSPTQELTEIFTQSNVPLTAESGELWMRLRFGDTLQDDVEAWLGLQLVDRAELRSNCFSLKLHFEVEPVAGLSRRLTHWASAGCHRNGGGS